MSTDNVCQTKDLPNYFDGNRNDVPRYRQAIATYRNGKLADPVCKRCQDDQVQCVVDRVKDYRCARCIIRAKTCERGKQKKKGKKRAAPAPATPTQPLVATSTGFQPTARGTVSEYGANHAYGSQSSARYGFPPDPALSAHASSGPLPAHATFSGSALAYEPAAVQYSAWPLIASSGSYAGAHYYYHPNDPALMGHFAPLPPHAFAPLAPITPTHAPVPRAPVSSQPSFAPKIAAVRAAINALVAHQSDNAQSDTHAVALGNEANRAFTALEKELEED